MPDNSARRLTPGGYGHRGRTRKGHPSDREAALRLFWTLPQHRSLNPSILSAAPHASAALVINVNQVACPLQSFTGSLWVVCRSRQLLQALDSRCRSTTATETRLFRSCSVLHNFQHRAFNAIFKE